MFWVINKGKVYSYIVTLSIIGVLFMMPTFVSRDDSVETSAKQNQTNNVNNTLNYIEIDGIMEVE